MKIKPLKNEEQVHQNTDPHIEQAFPGFPHLPADKKSIIPITQTEKKSANANKKNQKHLWRQIEAVGKSLV